MSKYYCVYNMQDEFVNEYRNYKELNTFFNKNTLDTLMASVCKLKKGMTNRIKRKGTNEWYKVYVMED